MYMSEEGDFDLLCIGSGPAGQWVAVQAAGTDATELTHIGQAVLEPGEGLQYFLQTVFNYPTLAECYKVAALDTSISCRTKTPARFVASRYTARFLHDRPVKDLGSCVSNHQRQLGRDPEHFESFFFHQHSDSLRLEEP